MKHRAQEPGSCGITTGLPPDTISTTSGGVDADRCGDLAGVSPWHASLLLTLVPTVCRPGGEDEGEATSEASGPLEEVGVQEEEGEATTEASGPLKEVGVQEEEGEAAHNGGGPPTVLVVPPSVHQLPSHSMVSPHP